MRTMHAPRETISELSLRGDLPAVLIFRFAYLHRGSEIRENKEDTRVREVLPWAKTATTLSDAS